MRYAGNANKDAADRGWFLGPFKPVESPLSSKAVEIKWATHPPNDGKPVKPDGPGMTITILIEGEFKMIFPEEEFVLRRPGDFVVWGPGDSHGWEAVKQSLMLTVRWAVLS